MKEVSSLGKSSKTKSTKLDVKRNAVQRDLYYKAPLIAALLTGICFLVLCIISRIYPLGDYTMTASDLEAQYAPFLFMFKRHILNLDWSNLVSSFSYSTQIGMGKNMMGTYGYYLASPFNILVFLFDASQVSLFIAVLTGTKLMTASAFMTIFMHERSTDKKSNWPILLGVMYAFTAYTMVYIMNIMWLDAYLALPLLLYFIEKYIENGKHAGIVVVLLYMFISNYYVAYMAGIFSFIYLIVRLLELDKLKKNKATVALIVDFVLIAICCALICGVLLLPVGLDTITNADPIKSSASRSYISFVGIDFLDQLFLGCPGEFGEVMPNNLPFVFISLMTNLLCVIYFISDVFKGKERRIHAVCTVLVYLSLAFKPLDIAWHIFDEPNWFWHRQVFVFIPLFLIITLKAIERIKEVSNKDIGKAAGILVIFLLIAQSFGQMRLRESVFITNLLFIGVFALIFVGMKRTKWPEQLKNMNKLLPFILALIVVVETSTISNVLSGGIAAMSVYYGDGLQHSQSIVATTDAANAARHRGVGSRFTLENTNEGDDITSINDNSAYYAGFNGISLFNSNSNKPLHRFLKQFGFKTNFNYFSSNYTYSAMDTDAFLSIGSLFTRQPYSDARYYTNDSFNLGLRFNGYSDVLPIAFAVDSAATEFDFYQLEKATEDKDYLSFRNAWYRSLFPEQFTEDYFVAFEVPEATLLNGVELDLSQYSNYSQAYIDSMNSASQSVRGTNPDRLGIEPGSESDATHTIYRNNAKIPIIIEYTFEAPNAEELYLNISANRVMNECAVYVNGRLNNFWSEKSFYSPVLRLGAFEPGETVVVTLMNDCDKFQYLDINFAYFDSDIFSSSFAQVDKSKVVVNDYSNGHAAFTTNLTDSEIVLTTIPYENGWEAYVDGKKVDIIAYQDALIAIDAGSGAHNVELKFVAPGLKSGAIVSVVGIMALVAFELVKRKKV